MYLINRITNGKRACNTKVLLSNAKDVIYLKLSLNKYLENIININNICKFDK